MPKSPEIIPRLSRSELDEFSIPNSRTYLRPLHKILKANGVFGKEPDHKIAERLYDKSTVNPKYRYDAIISGRPHLHPKEIDFFISAIAYALEDKTIIDTLDASVILNGKAQLIVKDLLEAKHGGKTTIDIGNIDPLTGILRLASQKSTQLSITFLPPDCPSLLHLKHRGVNNPAKKSITFNEDTISIFQPGDQFYIRIDDYHLEKQMQYPPIVIEVSYSGGMTDDGADYQASVLTEPYRKPEPDPRDRAGNRDRYYWLNSLEKTSPWTLNEDHGRFAFLVLGHAGKDIKTLLPKASDTGNLTKDDLQFLYARLLECSSSADPIFYGMQNFCVIEKRPSE